MDSRKSDLKLRLYYINNAQRLRSELPIPLGSSAVFIQEFALTALETGSTTSVTQINATAAKAPGKAKRKLR